MENTSLNRFLRPGTHRAGNGSRAPLVDSNQQIIMNDYRHAARIFTDGNFRLSPKYGFLFYVEFDLNPLITNISNISAQEMGMIVKSVALPKYTVDTKTHNAYNRKNIVQNSIKYDPISIVFHDDQADTVRQFWYDYYSYFYRDPDYADSTYSSPHKYQSRPSFDWGYSPRPAVGYNTSSGIQPYQYIQAIRIYSLYQKQFSEYQLVNPIITSFKHGDHNVGENTGLLQHEMSVQFETVKYLTGTVTSNNAGGFIDLHYDNTPSPIVDPAGELTQYVSDGMGGIARINDTITDLADNTTSVNPYLRTDSGLASTSLNPASGFGSAWGSTTLLTASGTANGGGYIFPGFGSLNQGVASSQQLNQQLQAAGIGLVNRSATTLANGVMNGVTQGLGPNGKSIVGLAVASVTNPKAVIATAQNMAISYATAKVTNYVTNQVINPLAAKATDAVGTFVSDNIAKPVSEAFNNFAAANFTADFNFSLGIGQYAIGSSAADAVSWDW
jgi:hypothetical protein